MRCEHPAGAEMSQGVRVEHVPSGRREETAQKAFDTVNLMFRPTAGRVDRSGV